MAKVTDQEITQVFRQLEEVYSRALAENTALEAKANQLAQSINQPDAQQKLDQLLSERLAIQSNANNQIRSLNATLDGYIANSTTSQKKLIINEKKRVNEIALRAKAVGDNVGNNIIPDLQAQISAPITAETPAPTFNTDVEDVPNENDLTGEADGDFQSGVNASEGQTGDGSTTGGNEDTNNPSDNTATKPQKDGQQGPGKRLKNPLSKFASVNYQITLYMITPEAYDAFVASGRKNINVLNNVAQTGSGAYVIAQTGGINENTTQRAPGFNLDYYIDNLKIITYASGKSTYTASNNTEIFFDIVEPYGFSFATNLRRAADSIASYSKSLGNKKLQNPSRQFFILGIRFYGYNQNGTVQTAQSSFGEDVLDPGGEGQAVFERFYDFKITQIKFKLDGNVSKYNIEGHATSPGEAYGAKRGVINYTVPIEASNVGEALEGPNGFLTRLNKEQQRMVDNGTQSKKNSYRITWLGDSELAIKGASLITDADLNKFRWAGSQAKNTDEVNDAESVKSVPDDTKVKITFGGGSPILQCIDQIIKQSKYLEDALKVIYTANVEPDPEKSDDTFIKPDSKKKIRWYNCSVEITNADWDDTLGDFTYDINYVIQPYETPVIQSLYVAPGINYYGPHKRYEYWYTGQNSEVLSYEQRLDNLYYNVALGPGVGPTSTDDRNKGAGQGGAADVPVVTGQRQPMNKQGRLNVGMEAQNSYITDLYSPDSYAEAKITILGDPDFLMQESTSSVSSLYNKFYGSDGFSISPNGGQVFIEIDFKEAVDYKNSEGLLSINDSIRFWAYPKSVSKLVKGVSYRVNRVDSRFANGVFTQIIEANINTFGDPEIDDDQDRQDDSSTTENSRDPTPSSTGVGSSSENTTSNLGLKVEPPQLRDNAPLDSIQPPSFNFGSEETVETDNGPVVDDDSSSGYYTPNNFGIDPGVFGDPTYQDIPEDEQRGGG